MLAGRKTLGRDPYGESYIDTVARSGYRFAAEIKVQLTPAIPPKPEPTVDPTDFPEELEDQDAERPLRPHLTLLMMVTPEVSAARLRSRQATLPFVRDRIEEGDRAFFDRVSHGYELIALAEPLRVRKVDGVGTVEAVHEAVWRHVEKELSRVMAAR